MDFYKGRMKKDHFLVLFKTASLVDDFNLKINCCKLRFAKRIKLCLLCPFFYSTVWKIEKFSTTQILREIIFGDFKSFRAGIFSISNFDFW